MNHACTARGLIALFAVTAAVVTFGLMRKPALAGGEDASVVWLQQEFDLNDAETAAVAALHASYRVLCDEHCQRIIARRREVVALTADQADPAEIAAATERLRQLDRQCREDLQAHVEAVAAAMGGSKGERYRTLIWPKVVAFDHSAPPDLRLEPQHLHDAGEPHH